MEKLYFEQFQKRMALNPDRVTQVEQYQAKHHIRLPEAYVEFISRGIDLGLWHWLGQTNITCLFEEIDDVVRKSRNCLQEMEADIGEFFPFAINHGDFFWFLRLNEGDNPAVYYFDSSIYDGKYQLSLALEVPFDPISTSTGLPHGMTKVTDSFTDFVFAYAKRDKTLKLD